MSSPIRPDLVKPYIHVPVKPKNAATNFVSQNMPVAAMFLKNKPIAWGCLFMAIQSWLNEPAFKDAEDSSTPPLFRVVLAFAAVFASYMDVFFPTMPPAAKIAAQAAADAAATATGN